MNDKAKKIINEALTLTEEERVQVAERLLNSIGSEEAQEVIDEAWRAEINRRSKEIELGSVKPISWSEVRKLAK